MKKVSFWAKNHIWQTRTIITLSYVLLCVIGDVTGRLIFGLNIVIPQLVLTTFLFGAGLLYFFYPDKENKNYIKRKTFDFALVFATFIMTILAGNHNGMINATETSFASSIIQPKDSSKSSLEKNPHIISFLDKLHHTDMTKLSGHDKKQILKQQIREIKQDKELTKSQKTGLILLSMVIALILMMGIAALSCNLACSGSGTLATIIWLGGWFFTLFFLARTINYINRGPRQRARQKRQDALKKEQSSIPPKENK